MPPYGAMQGGEAATIEFAVAGLGVKDIIVCGYSHCGAMKDLLERPPSRDVPALAQWLSHAEATRRIVQDKYAGRKGPSPINVTIQENVLAQMENLRKQPVSRRFREFHRDLEGGFSRRCRRVLGGFASEHGYCKQD